MNFILKKKSLLSLTLLFCAGSIYAQTFDKSPGHAYPPYHIKSGVSNLVPSGLTPAQVRNVYGFTAIANQGEGQTIAIVDAYDHPYIVSDLAVFSTQFGLPACTPANKCFTKVYARGRRPRADAGWAGEIALDVEWVHAIAPRAKILLVEAASSSFKELLYAVNVAVSKGASVVSMSWGGSEFSNQASYNYIFNRKNVTFTASSGDSGNGVMFPAVSPYVVSVGGTTLQTNSGGNYLGETAWDGSGGGVSDYQAIPTFQSSFPIPNNPQLKRGVPDVSYNADPETGFAVYNSMSIAGQSGWFVFGGTSAGAPQWAALFAIANSARTTKLNSVNTLLYNIGKANYALNYNDITDGSNGSCGYYCDARAGYDYVTGLGSPKAGALIQALITS